jgi:YbbR domain-containing protein
MKNLIIRPFIPLWSLIRYQFALKALSFFVAMTLWVVVFGSRTIEISKEVPFEAVVGEDQILVDPVPEKITFRLAGPKAFLRSINNRIDDPIRANVKDLKTGSFTHRIFSDSIKLPLGVKVLSISPNVIQLRVEEMKRKSVSVSVETVGALPDGLRPMKLELLPPVVRIKGPKNRVQMISSLSTVPVDLSGIHETTVIPVAFDFKSMGIDPDSPLPELNVEVQGKGTVFKVKHIPVKVRSTGKAIVQDEEVTLIVRSEGHDFMRVEADEVAASIDVRDMPSGEYQRWIKVQLPERMHLVRVIPASTRVLVKGQER